MADLNEYYQISLLLAKKATGTLTEEEARRLDNWRKASPENEILYQSTFDSRERNDRDQYVGHINSEHAWKKVRQHIIPAKNRSKKIYFFCRVAAIATILIGVSILLIQKTEYEKNTPSSLTAEIKTGGYKAILITEEGKKIELQDTSVKKININGGLVINNSGQMVDYRTDNSQINTTKQDIYHRLIIPTGGEFQITLGDGSVVWLNSGTELRFPVTFTGKSREIYLKGEAYFSVRKDATHPFIINLENNIQVEVLGTEFNISAYPGDSFIQTTLSTGAVKMTTPNQSIHLTPNQQATCNLTTGTMQLRTVTAANYSAWKDGKFIFEDERMETIMTRLSRWYNLNIFYQSPEIKEFHFTGDLEKYEDFRTILNMIEKSTNISFEISGNTLTIKEIKK